MNKASFDPSKSPSQAIPSSEGWLLAGHYDPGFCSFVLGEIESLGSLGPNWDGYNAPAIDKQILAAARQFILNLPENIAYRPAVVPTSTGGIQLEWDEGSKSLELEFDSPNTVSFLRWDPDQNISEEGAFSTRETERALALIQWFMAGNA